MELVVVVVTMVIGDYGIGGGGGDGDVTDDYGAGSRSVDDDS